MDHEVLKERCEQLCAAEQKEKELRSYISGLPKDGTKNLGLEVTLGWSSSSNPGHGQAEWALRAHLDRNFHTILHAELLARREETAERRSELVRYIKGCT